jgi:hypothetical protein
VSLSPIASKNASNASACIDAYKRVANLSDGMDTDQVVASLRATREIALELGLATVADPVAARHFKDAADASLKAPPIPPHASLDAMSRSDIDRLQAATGKGGDAMHAGDRSAEELAHPVSLRSTKTTGQLRVRSEQWV